ncbi:hypothetical protein FIBSPDRAFT_851453 [Athelia psychrophila]|uniref:Uncharacterized protein n=1 Tax=Athelia psychrophila TaxID=1759441 RepID=A0A166SHC2_9AGAM|nr:hypothetical protein FIBSPDRAFT_851453 [Fibularhizoctonia sp. CBS 109695]
MTYRVELEHRPHHSLNNRPVDASMRSYRAESMQSDMRPDAQMRFILPWSHDPLSMGRGHSTAVATSRLRPPPKSTSHPAAPPTHSSSFGPACISTIGHPRTSFKHAGVQYCIRGRASTPSSSACRALQVNLEDRRHPATPARLYQHFRLVSCGSSAHMAIL